MRDRRVLPVPPPDGVRPLRPEQAGIGPGVPGTGLGTVETPIGVLPLPLVLAGAVAVLAAVAVSLYLWHRGRTARAPFPVPVPAAFSAPVPGPFPGPFSEPAPGPFPATPPAPPFPGTPAGPQDDETTGPVAASGVDAAADPLTALTAALAEVAGSGISPALAQQVERLLAGGNPGREALVAACIGYRDQLAERHPRLAGTLLDGLNRAGVREIVADGQRFDPRLHEASGTEPAPRPGLHDLVAETVRRGYADGERVVRVPRVVVYRDGSAGAGPGH